MYCNDKTASQQLHLHEYNKPNTQRKLAQNSGILKNAWFHLLWCKKKKTIDSAVIFGRPVACDVTECLVLSCLVRSCLTHITRHSASALSSQSNCRARRNIHSSCASCMHAWYAHQLSCMKHYVPISTNTKKHTLTSGIPNNETLTVSWMYTSDLRSYIQRFYDYLRLD